MLPNILILFFHFPSNLRVYKTHDTSLKATVYLSVSGEKYYVTFVARKLKRRCHNFVPQSWYLLWVKHLETVPPPAIRLWVFPLGGWRRKQTLATVQQTDFWFQNGTFCCPIIHRRTHKKLSPILMRVQTYQITILCPFRVFFGSTSHAIFLCSWDLEIWQSSWVTN